MHRSLGFALAMIAGATLIACGSKSGDKSSEQLSPGCKLLYKRYDKCDTMPITERAFVKLCKKHKERERTKAEIACSAKKDCGEFKQCLKDARRKGRVERMKKRWKKAMDEAKTGKWSSARIFCDVWKKDLDEAMKKECDGLPAKATAAMIKDITAKRDKGQVSYKDVKCYALKRMAKKAGPDKLKAAETLCEEVKVARSLQRAKKEADKQMKKERPYLPYQCGEKKLEKMETLGTPFAKKVRTELIELCYKKLAKVILAKKVPKMKYFCSVKRVYKGIQKYQVKDPELDKWMAKAKAKCEKK